MRILTKSQWNMQTIDESLRIFTKQAENWRDLTNLHILFCECHSVMDHNYVRDEENEEEILRGIWENAHPDAGGEDAGNGTNAGDGTDAGRGTEQTGQ